MPNKERRKELGKTILDIAKYTTTVGIIGSALAERVTYQAIAALGFIALAAFIVGFYTIPRRGEK